MALYLRIFQEWAQTHPAEAVLSEMLKRRVELGLAEDPPTKLDTSKLIPVIAFGGECKSAKSKDTINKRMKQLADEIQGQDVDLSQLEIWWNRDDGRELTVPVGQL